MCLRRIGWEGWNSVRNRVLGEGTAVCPETSAAYLRIFQCDYVGWGKEACKVIRVQDSQSSPQALKLGRLKAVGGCEGLFTRGMKLSDFCF